MRPNPAPVLLFALALAGLVSSLPAAGLPAGFRPLDGTDYRPARISEREPELRVDFPGSASNRGIGEGEAVVSVGVDAEGRATDFLVVGCSDEAFGRTLLDWVKPLAFQPATLHGRAVPGRCEIGYRFQFHSNTGGAHGFGFSAWGSTSGGLNASALSVSLLDVFSGRELKKQPAYRPAAETELDRPLEFADVCLPRLPAGFSAPTDRPVKVFVSFYIDAEGRTRAPRVESEVAPELVAPALKAVSLWSFKPPVAHGKPALVLTARSVGFVPRTD
jgi:hypothetical protein